MWTLASFSNFLLISIQMRQKLNILPLFLVQVSIREEVEKSENYKGRLLLLFGPGTRPFALSCPQCQSYKGQKLIIGKLF